MSNPTTKHCADCGMAILKKRRYYAENRARILARNRERRKSDPEFRKKELEATKRWRKKNPEKVRSTSHRWTSADPKQDRERVRRWRAANPQKLRDANHRRRARKFSAYVADVTQSDVSRMLSAQGGMCVAPGCGRDIRGAFHVDHIIPLARGGTHEPANVQLLCPTCNCAKRAKLPAEFARARGWLF